MQGTIIKSTGSWYHVRTEQGQVWNCRIKGKFKLKDYKLTNPVAVGDHVKFDTEKEEGHGIITEIMPRKNFVLRRSTRQKHFMHLIACNVDQALVVVTIKRPNIKPGFIDRFLLTTESYEIPTYIIFNKADIYDAEDMELYEALHIIYKHAGYQTMLVSAESGQGIDELKSVLKDKTTLFSGHSGVGKSTLVNALQPQLELRTGNISDITDKGMHTTTFAEMFELDFGGRIIDTPGIKELGFLNMKPIEVPHNFPEIFALSPQCKYANCLHINEPNCAVKAAVEVEEIHPIRYQSYLSIMEEVMEQNHWERHDI